jgi:hypothetical protein
LNFNNGHWTAGGSAACSTPTACFLVLQSDGNLVVYHPTGVVWASNTDWVREPVFLRVLDTGNLVIAKQSDGTIVWSVS